jgi:DNA-binding transcriptional ArsR family regulator
MPRQQIDVPGPLPVPGAERLVELAEVFRLMGDPSRLKILALVMQGPRAVGEIAAASGLSPSLVSHHLRLLRARRLVRAERRGKQVFYAVDDVHIHCVLADMIEHLDEAAPASPGARTP